MRAIAAVGAVLMLVSQAPLVGGSGAAQDAPQSSASFRVGVDLVNVDVSVTDDRGRFVGDLRREDFEVLEDGKRQDVSAFAPVNLPIETRPTTGTSAAPLPPESDVRTNTQDDGGRVYIIVLDDLHVQPARTARIREVARRFVEQYVGPDDLAAVVHTSGRAGASQDVTTNRHLLLDAVDRFNGQGMRSSMLDRLEDYQDREIRESDRADQRLNHIQDPQSMIRADYARRLLKTLTNVGELLAAVAGRRKALVLFSEGVAYDLAPKMVQTASGLNTFTGGAFPEVVSEVQQAVRAAAQANIAIYAIDPRGLVAPGEDTIDVTSFPVSPLLGVTPAAFQSEVRQAQDSLRILADLTGGAASVSSNDFGPILDRIVADNSTYYMLGYRSNASTKDQRYRTIEVRVKRPGVRVRARPGYLPGTPAAPPEILTHAIEASAPLRNALNSPLPVAGIRMRMFAAPFKQDKAASVAVGIELDARQFAFKEEKGLQTDSVDVSIVALDDRGRFIAGDRYTVDLRLKPDTFEAVRQHGLRVLFRLELPSGRFQLRAAAHEAGRGAVASLIYDLVVPEFATPALAMSGLVLTAPEARQRATARADATLSRTLPTPPTALRSFRAGETVTAFFEVYGATPPTDVDVVTSLHRGDGSALVSKSEHASTQEIGDGGGGVGFAIPIGLTNLDDGAYVLRVAVQARSGATRLVREIPLQVYGASGTP